MSATLKKSGSFVAFSWQGKLLDPHDHAFAKALATQRFRSIETAASEETSAGWVTPVDPTGDEFALDELDAGPATWLRVRIDVKKLPAELLDRHRTIAEKAKGRPLTARERRELKDDLIEQMLPRILPTTTNLDALLFHGQRRVLLFSTSKSARETFGKLFCESFGAVLEVLGPLQVGRRQLVDDVKCDALDRLEPTRWPVAKGGAS